MASLLVYEYARQRQNDSQGLLPCHSVVTALVLCVRLMSVRDTSPFLQVLTGMMAFSLHVPLWLGLGVRAEILQVERK